MEGQRHIWYRVIRTPEWAQGYGMGVGAKLYVRFVRRPEPMSLLFRGVPSVVRVWNGPLSEPGGAASHLVPRNSDSRMGPMG